MVAWYLPTLTDTARDLRRLVAASELKVDGLAVDIEATNIDDVPERTRRLVELSQPAPRRDRRRAADRRDHPVGGAPAGGEPGVLARLPLGRDRADLRPSSCRWRTGRSDPASSATAAATSATTSTASARRPDETDLPIHVIGGIADGVTSADLDGMVAALESRGAIGGSLYDWATSSEDQWQRLAPLRTLRVFDPTPTGGRRGPFLVGDAPGFVLRRGWCSSTKLPAGRRGTPGGPSRRVRGRSPSRPRRSRSSGHGGVEVVDLEGEVLTEAGGDQTPR